MMVRTARSLGGAAVLALALARCGSFESAPETSSDGGPPATDGATDGAPLEDANVVDSAPPLPDAGDAGPRCDSGCPGSAGPCGVRIGTDNACIDDTEVTVGQYRAFVASVGSTPLDAGAPCPATSPVATDMGQAANLPMTRVSFCQARAFCAWSGKQLCGHVTGRPLAAGEVSTQGSLWFKACTGGSGSGQKLLSDGGCQLEAGAPRPAGSGCEGSEPGLFDLVGNVHEWVEFTQPSDGGTYGGFFVGGAYGFPSDTPCGYTSGSTITFAGVDVGFRCCSY